MSSSLSGLFTHPETGKAAADIAFQIESAILGRKILPGERLPSERDLQVQFGTGRGAVREALQTLKQKGLITVKKGRSGAFVRETEVQDVSASLSLFLKQKNLRFEQLVEFRETIDRTITSLALVRADEQQRDLLLNQAVKLQKQVGEKQTPVKNIEETDRELNMLLAKMSKNPIFEWVMGAVQLGFSSYDYALYEKETFRSLTAENWVQTALHIKNRESVKALSCISHHYYLLRQCRDEKNKNCS